MESHKLLKEWDVESQNRKWKHSYAISPVPTSTGNPLIYILDSEENPPEIIYREISKGGIIGETNKKLVDGLPYFHFESRFYPTRGFPPGWCVIHKRVAKAFKVGLSTDSYYASKYRDDFDTFADLPISSLSLFTFGEPFLPIDDPFRTIGAIAPRLFVGKSKLFYMTTPIGLINRKERIISLGHESILQEVSDALRKHKCQINIL